MMKGPNPFARWESDPSAICGRKDESRIFNGFASGVSAGQGGLLVLSGGPGEGKTTMLRHFQAEGERAGLLTVYVNAERREDEKEIAGKAFGEIPQAPGHHPPTPPDSFEKLAAAVEKAAKGGFGALIIIDDLDRMRKAPEALSALSRLAKAGWGRRKVGFVVSTTRAMDERSEVVTAIELRPFEEHEARELVEKALGKGPPKMGDECLASILADSGGNPKLIKSVCRHIYDKLRDNEKLITKGHYLGYLQYIMSMLSREWFGSMYQLTPPSERRILSELARSEDGLHVSDIAARLAKPLGPVTALIGRLAESGQVVRVGRGRYRVFSKLYARYVVQRS